MRSDVLQGLMRRPIALTWFIVVSFIFAKAFLLGLIGLVGPDSDDLMRLIQVRDFLAGQSWFDLHQYRLGAEPGTLMHWSRIPDIPLIVLISTFDLVLPYAYAEAVAITVWPPISSLAVVIGLITAARHLNVRFGVATVSILSILFLMNNHRFAPGALDHHNLQLGLLALSLGCLLDPALRMRSMIGAGVMLGITFTIGMEIYVFSAILCVTIACFWLYHGEHARKAVIAFGLSFSAILALVFFTTIAPQNYSKIYCDAYSSIILEVGSIAGLGLALIGTLLSRRSILIRGGALFGLGAVCLAFVGVAAPQCLSNPLAALPDEARLVWLAMIQEAKPVWGIPESIAIVIPYMLGVQFLAFGLCVSQLVRKQHITHNLLFAILNISALALTIYQVRFLQFGFLFSILPLALWIARIYNQAVEQKSQRSGAIGALALSMPFMWALPAAWIEASFAADGGVKPVEEFEELANPEACYGPQFFDALNQLPSSLIAANANAAPFILDQTRHRVLIGNYHRNPQGIVDAIRAYTYAPEFALPILKKNHVDYLVFCHPTNFSRAMIEHNGEGLFATLAAGQVPAYLSLVAEPTIETPQMSGSVRIYRVENGGSR